VPPLLRGLPALQRPGQDGRALADRPVQAIRVVVVGALLVLGFLMVTSAVPCG
jgi:hypothetical protein